MELHAFVHVSEIPILSDNQCTVQRSIFKEISLTFYNFETLNHVFVLKWDICISFLHQLNSNVKSRARKSPN